MTKTVLNVTTAITALIGVAAAQTPPGAEQGDGAAVAVPQGVLATGDLGAYWMDLTGWTPEIAARAGNGDGVIVALIDTQLADPRILGGDVLGTFGFVAASPLHGQAVASVIGASVGDGRTVGVAPEADFIVANPFAGRAGATTEGIIGAIGGSAELGASVANLSLGRPGSVLAGNWQDILQDRELVAAARDTVLVKSAGNDGLAQPYDLVIRDQRLYDQLLIVGSVGPDGQISAFSNTPGDACVLRSARQRWCLPSQRLANRFLVAPGEEILTDLGLDLGGFRATGTSFAAPLVTGTVALMQSQWPWLKRQPEATSAIILATATDLGEPGVDGVYGHGLLNIEGALSPLQNRGFFRNLFRGARGPIRRVSAGDIYNDDVDGGIVPSAAPYGPTAAMAALFAPEATTPMIQGFMGTHRDFDVSLGALAQDGQVGGLHAAQASARGAFEPMGRQFDAAAVRHRLRADAAAGITVSERAGVVTTALLSPARADRLAPGGALPYEVTYLRQDERTGDRLAWGAGRGALYALAPVSAPTAGGAGTAEDADPILALASGGAFLAADLGLAPNVRLSFGATQDHRDHYAQPFGTAQVVRDRSIDAYAAQAVTAGLSYEADRLGTIGVRLAVLGEQAGLLGGQGADAFAVAGQARTVALSTGYEAEAPLGFDVTATATIARTTTTAETGLRVDRAVTASAFHLAASRRDLAAPGDGLRLAVFQPLTTEGGAFAHETLAITDRETGDMGIVTRRLQAGAARPIVAELAYERPALSGRVSLFGRAVSTDRPGEAAMLGARFGLGF